MEYRRFFYRDSAEVAKDLLGKVIVRNTEKGATGARIIETGAYEQGNPVPSRDGMKYSPGTIFLMPWRGSHLLNIATEKAGEPACVEIRAIAYHDKTIKGSGAVSNELNITPDLDGIVLGNEVQILGESVGPEKVRKRKGQAENCVGYFSIKK